MNKYITTLEDEDKIYNNISNIKKTNQIYIGSIIDKEILKSFNLTHIFECGQCFRWKKEDLDNKKYIGIIFGRVIEVKEKDGIIHFFSSIKDSEINCFDQKEQKHNELVNEIKNDLIKYFDLDRDYSKCKKDILDKTKPEIKEEVEKSIEYGYGIRILNQDPFETIITYIISANNNIPRIKSIVEKICIRYGKEIKFKGKTYYSFPNVLELKDAKISDFREMGAGFRDKRIYETINMIRINGIDEYLKNKESLMSLPGVGPKVAECIMLFSLGKIDTFPIDTWVRRVTNDIYFKLLDENDLKRKDIEEFGNSFGDYSGLLQQYLFYWRREK